MYTLEDLEKARQKLASIQEHWANYTGNNPDKYDSDLKAARREIRIIESYLKSTGALPLTEQEQLDKLLDSLHPNAQSREIVEHEGKRYQKRFYPIEKSRSRKTVTEWGSHWELLESE
jgi:hypothetical protein